MEKRVLTVLRSGGDFRPEHAQALARQVERWAPDAKFQCLTDTDVPGVDCIALKHDWPGWWSKLELFREELGGHFLFTDLDNVILGPLDDLFTGFYTTQRRGWNALMYVPRDLSAIYEEFRHAPGEHMAANGPTGINGKPFGDAGFVAERGLGLFWEDIVPEQVVNICELRRRAPWPFQAGIPPPDTARVLLHSNRYGRPWDMPEFEHLYGEKP
jgi:hypothetical protein